MKKIAVPSDDGIGIAEHFGRCAAFLIFAIEEGKISSQESRANGGGGARHGECQSAGAHAHGPAHGHHHAVMGQILKDCEAVLCKGMGWRAAEALKAQGITPLMVQTGLPAQAAVEAFLAGQLAAGESYCSCHH